MVLIYPTTIILSKPRSQQNKGFLGSQRLVFSQVAPASQLELCQKLTYLRESIQRLPSTIEQAEKLLILVKKKFQEAGGPSKLNSFFQTQFYVQRAQTSFKYLGGLVVVFPPQSIRFQPIDMVLQSVLAVGIFPFIY